MRAKGHMWLYALIMGVNCTSVSTTSLIGWIPITVTSVITTKSLLGEIVLSTIRWGLVSATAIVRHPTSIGAHSRLGYLWVLLMRRCRIPSNMPLSLGCWCSRWHRWSIEKRALLKVFLISMSIPNEGKRCNTSPRSTMFEPRDPKVIPSRAPGLWGPPLTVLRGPPLTTGCGMDGDICGEATRGFGTAGAARLGEETGPPGGKEPN